METKKEEVRDSVPTGVIFPFPSYSPEFDAIGHLIRVIFIRENVQTPG